MFKPRLSLLPSLTYLLAVQLEIESCPTTKYVELVVGQRELELDSGVPTPGPTSHYLVVAPATTTSIVGQSGLLCTMFSSFILGCLVVRLRSTCMSTCNIRREYTVYYTSFFTMS